MSLGIGIFLNLSSDSNVWLRLRNHCPRDLSLRGGSGPFMGWKAFEKIMAIAHKMYLVLVVSWARQDWAWLFLGRKIVLEKVDDIPWRVKIRKSGIWEVIRNSVIQPTWIKLAHLLLGRLGKERSQEGLTRTTQKRNLKTMQKHWVPFIWLKRTIVS